MTTSFPCTLPSNHHRTCSIGIETQKDWEGRAKMTETKTPGAQKVWRFEQLLLADRSATFRGNITPGRNSRIVSEAWEATKEEASKWWWEPVRRSVLRFAGVDQKTMDLPVMWEKEFDTVSNGDVKLTDKEVEVAKTASRRMPVVITYVVRGGNRRAMVKEDHEVGNRLFFLMWAGFAVDVKAAMSVV